MFARKLKCSREDWEEPIQGLRNLCPKCGSPLLVDYQITSAPELRGEIRRRPANLWRYRELLPITSEAEVITLGEGATPMLEAQRVGKDIGLPRVFFKDESLNPTRSFKSRGMAVAVAMARKLGAPALAVPTAGNAGCAMAAYAARAGVKAFIAMPKDTPQSILRECRDYGAEVELVEGLITDAAKRVREVVEQRGAFDVSTLREPYRVEGKKIMGYELLEDLGRLPDVVLYPTGGGTGLVGMWKAFDEMQRLGWIGAGRPRMYAVQSSGCAPIVRAFDQGLDEAPEWSSPVTTAWGLRVPRAIGDRLMLRALRQSKGGAVAVEEAQIEPAAAELRIKEGLDAGPESGAAFVALRHLAAAGAIRAADTVVVFNTGGNKYH